MHFSQTPLGVAVAPIFTNNVADTAPNKNPPASVRITAPGSDSPVTIA
jgi:hypothetical protein